MGQPKSTPPQNQEKCLGTWKTLYCDHITWRGKPREQITPHLNRKERTAADKVVSEFNRTKDMQVHRLERTQYDKKSSPIDLAREEYYR